MTISREVLSIEDAMQEALDVILGRHDRVLTRAWAEAWQSVREDWEDILTVLAADGVVDGRTIALTARAGEGLARTRAVLEELARITGDTISGDALQALTVGAEGEYQMIQAQLPPRWAGLTRVDTEQLHAIAARVTEQITATSWPISDDTDLAIRRELLRGMIVGDNPRVAAERMVLHIETPFTGGLPRALNISRTEMLDAMRTAQQVTDHANAAVVTGWTWGAHLDSRTCPSCIAMHGTAWGIEEPGPIDHHSGRCARIPRTRSWAELGVKGVPEPPDMLPDAMDWFTSLGPDEQRAILGGRGFDAWQAGDFPPDRWAVRRSTDGWRDAYHYQPPPKGTR